MRTGKSTVFGVLLGIGLWLAGCGQDSRELVVSGRIEVDDMHIGSKIGGRVWKVNFDESDHVKVGEPIVLLDDNELKAQMAQAKSALGQAQAQLDLLLAGTRAEDIERAEAVVGAQKAELALRLKGFRQEEIGQAEARLAQAKSALDLAEKELKRFETLFRNGTIGQQDYDTKRTAYTTAKAGVDQAAQALALVRSGSRPEETAAAQAQLAQGEADLKRLRAGPRPEEIAAQRAAVEQAKANIERLQSLLDETQICAPANAVVETLELKPGDLVKPGETVAVLNLLNEPWVRCYVPENRMGWVKPGNEVAITVDSFPNEKFRGKIRRLAADAEFTPRNAQTTEKRSELVFEMKVDLLNAGERLRAGMFADVHIPKAGATP